MKNKQFIFILLVLICILSQLLPSQTIIHTPETLKSLEFRWDWALKTADKMAVKEGFYIGYSIEQEKERYVCRRSYKWYEREEDTLCKLLYGKNAVKNRIGRFENEVAILFQFDHRCKDRFDFQKIKIRNMDHPVELDNVPLFWLGCIRTDESIELLQACFKYTGSNYIREKIVTAAGIHGPNRQVFRFLKSVITGNYVYDIRKSAVFWMGQQQNVEAAKLLEQTVHNDRSSEVRKHAVFALHLVKCKEADDALVKLAKKGSEKCIRKKAIFWLGQKAVKRSAEILEGVVYEDSDSDIRKAAVFALSQLREGVSKLIKIAKTHRSLKVRKQAIFWLSQSDDPRALDTILSILEK